MNKSDYILFGLLLAMLIVVCVMKYFHPEEVLHFNKIEITSDDVYFFKGNNSLWP